VHLSAAQVEKLLYKQSGLLGISGIRNDMRTLLASPDPAARLAVGLLRLPGAKQMAALAAVSAEWTRGLHRRDREPLRRDPAPHLEASAMARRNVGPNANAHTDEDHHGGQSGLGLVSDQRKLMIARHTAALLGIAGRRA